MEQVDALVIGAGMAGVPLALRLGFKGLKTVLVERAEVGGTCLNRGCIPTKTMIASARVAHLARSAAHYGVRTGPVQVDLKEVVARKDALVTSVRAGSERNLLENPNVELLRGEARFVGERRVVVGDREISAERVFINTGARNRTPALQGLEEVAWLDSTSALYLSELPRSLLIVGGGYVGCEFAQMYARFGTRVTLVQRHSQLLPQEDADVVAELQRVFQAEDVELVLKAEAERVCSEGGQVVLSVRQEGKERELRAERLMLAAGREPNTKELNLVAAGVKTDGAGFIRVDEHLETGAPGVWALGDVRGGPMFTHTARDDARIVYENVMKGTGLSTQDRVVPYAVFTDPQLGRVGLNEKQARAAGYRVKIGRYEGRKVAKARALGEPAGLIKIVADAESDRLLGASVLLAEGAEVVHELVSAIALGARYTDLRSLIHIHPTLAEGLSSALGGVHYEEGI